MIKQSRTEAEGRRKKKPQSLSTASQCKKHRGFNAAALCRLNNAATLRAFASL